MTDHLTSLGLSAVAAYLGKDGLQKLLGPTADYLGTGLKDFTQKRAEAVGKIFSSAQQKLGEKVNQAGEVPPKVLKTVLNEGSYSTDQLTVLNEGSYSTDQLTTHHYATQVFQEKMTALLAEAKEIDKESVMPDKYMLIVTEEIGQDKRNDISHAAIITLQADGTQDVDKIFHNQRIFYEYAMTLGCAHAVALGVKAVRWRKDYTYTWR